MRDAAHESSNGNEASRSAIMANIIWVQHKHWVTCPHCPGVPVCSWALQKWLLKKIAHSRKSDIFLQPTKIRWRHYMVIIDASRYDFMNLRFKFNDMCWNKRETNFVAVLFRQIWNIEHRRRGRRGRVYRFRGRKTTGWRVDITSVGYANTFDATICWM